MTARDPQGPGRRRFLKALTGVGLLASSFPAPAASSQVASSIRGLAIALGAEHGVRQIGAAHLRAHPRMASEARLLQDLVDSATLGGDTDVDSVAQALDEAIARDFERGRVQLVDGWCLSLTELRFCALRSLVAVAS